MQERHYKTILYFISAVILATLAIQVYWNFKNYEAGRQQLLRDVQTSLNESVDQYYVDRAEENLIGFSIDETGTTSSNSSIDSITKALEFTENGFFLDSAAANSMKSISIFKGSDVKNIDKLDRKLLIDSTERRDAIKFFMGDTDVRKNNLAKLTTKIIFSMSTDSLNLSKMDSLIGENLKQKSIPIDYALTYKDASNKVFTTNESIIPQASLKLSSSSDYLHKNTSLELSFTNETKTILQRNFLGILLSFLLIGAVIASLLYLLKIIQEQKQLAEIKNDFISNITHEFKTPIATIGVAMESIQFFNDANDVEKTKKYVDMSSQQVAKLNTMVEKLLETATLDSEALMLNKQEANMAQLLEHISQSHQATLNGKTLSLDIANNNIEISVDLFHLENALDNIIDNAIKYGGDHIKIRLHKASSGIHIDITDGGNDLTKTQSQQIFEKFYRVPKGNTHDVKGFGIGLYYTKTIIEKHGGTITVQTQPTTFKITLPYV